MQGISAERRAIDGFKGKVTYRASLMPCLGDSNEGVLSGTIRLFLDVWIYLDPHDIVTASLNCNVLLCFRPPTDIDSPMFNRQSMHLTAALAMAATLFLMPLSARADKPIRIVAFGDSLVAGYGLSLIHI